MLKPSDIKLIPPLDTYPRLVKFVHGVPGKVILLVVYAIGLSLHTSGWKAITIVLTALTFFPKYRAIILVVATFGFIYLKNWPNLEILNTIIYPAWTPNFAFKPLVIAMVMGVFFVYYHAVKRYKGFGQRPIRNLLVSYVVLIAIVSHASSISTTVLVTMWAFVITFGKYLWFFNYALLDLHAKDTPPLFLQTGYFRPFWGGSGTPFPKGAAYLRRIEAKTPEQLAVCQLKGVKLLYWALILTLLNKLLWKVFYGKSYIIGVPISLDIPSLHTVLTQTTGHLYPWYINWMALLANFTTNIIHISIWGHVIIATCRMAGYRALRNTYKPLQSASIADFWNRYYYYFKELLVDNFFYPAFLRYFKKSPRKRLFFATLAAAGFGNVLYHYLRDIEVIMKLGLFQALISFHVYIFYGLVLGSAIGFSQLFENKKRNTGSLIKRRVLKPMAVIGFYCLLSIFDDPDRSLVITTHFKFFFRLFNIHLD